MVPHLIPCYSQVVYITHGHAAIKGLACRNKFPRKETVLWAPRFTLINQFLFSSGIRSVAFSQAYTLSISGLKGGKRF